MNEELMGGIWNFSAHQQPVKKTVSVLERGGSNSGEKPMTIICSLQFDIIDINTKYVVDKLGGGYKCKIKFSKKALTAKWEKWREDSFHSIPFVVMYYSSFLCKVFGGN